MADKSNDRDVLTSLPRTRPSRRSTKRTAAPASSDGPQMASTPATPAAKPKAKAKPAAAAKPKAKAATKPKAKAAAKAKPKPKAKAAAKPRPEPEPATAAAPHLAEPVKDGAGPTAPSAPAVPPAGYAPARKEAPSSDNGGTDPLHTAIQAIEEIASIGVTLSKQILDSVASRLPRP